MTSLYIHAYATYEIYLYNIGLYDTVIIHVTAQNEINEHGYILRQYICVDINTKMRRKKTPKCNNGSFNLLQFALLRFALISSQNAVTKNVSVGVYLI